MYIYIYIFRSSLWLSPRLATLIYLPFLHVSSHFSFLFYIILKDFPFTTPIVGSPFFYAVLNLAWIACSFVSCRCIVEVWIMFGRSYVQWLAKVFEHFLPGILWMCRFSPRIRTNRTNIIIFRSPCMTIYWYLGCVDLNNYFAFLQRVNFFLKCNLKVCIYELLQTCIL